MKNGETFQYIEIKVVKSASRVCLGSTHPGRPENEEPHVKKTMKNKREITEYICKVDQVLSHYSHNLYY